MKKLLLSLLSILWFNLGFAQIQKTDSIYDIWKQTGDIEIVGNYAYLQSESGLQILNYANIESPEFIETVQLKGHFDYTIGNTLIAANGNYLYCGYINKDYETGGVEIFEISQSGMLTKMGEIDSEHGIVGNFLIKDNYLICTEFKNDPVFGDKMWLVSYNITDKTTPSKAFSEEIGSFGSLSTLQKDNFIFLQKTTGSFPMTTTTNYLYSAANPAMLMEVGEIGYFPNMKRDLALEDTLYTIYNPEYTIKDIYGLDISNPMVPDTFFVASASAYRENNFGFIKKQDNNLFAYNAKQGEVSQLILFDNSNEDQLVSSSTYDIPFGNMGEIYVDNFTIKNDTLLYSQDSASIVSVALGDNTHSPNTYFLNPDYYFMPDIIGVYISDSNAMITHRNVDENTFNTTYRFSTIDISDKENIIEKSNTISDNNTYAQNVKAAIYNDLMVVTYNENKTTLFNIEANGDLTEKGSITNQNIRSFTVIGNYLIVGSSSCASCATGTFKIYDISNRDIPMPVYQFSTTHNTKTLYVDSDNDLLYLVEPDNWNALIEVWDISTITAPVLDAEYSASIEGTSINNLYVTTNNLFAYSDQGGLYSYSVSGSSLTELDNIGYPVTTVTFNDNYAFIGSNDDSYGIKVVSLQNPSNLQETFLLPDNGGCVDLSASNDILMVAYSNTVDVYDMNSIPLAPGNFDLLSPQGTITSVDTVLIWEASIDPNGNTPEYEVWIADNASFTSADIDTTSETSYHVYNLLPGQSFYWKVEAIDEYLENVPSNQSFQCSLADIELNLLAVDVTDLEATLSWNETNVPDGMSVSYQIILANDAVYTNADTLTSTTKSLLISDLMPGQYYYWKVRAIDTNYTGEWYSPSTYFSSSVPIAALVYAKDLGSNSESGVSMLDPNTLYTASAGSVNRYFGSGDLNYTLQVNGMIKSSTTITPDHRVYIASTDNNIYAFNQNGISVSGWPVALGAQLEASVAVDDNHNLYLGTSNGIYQCISATGDVQWSYNVGSSVKASSAITNQDTLYVINSNGRVFAFDLNNINTNNPQPVWTLETNHAISNSPAIFGNSIVVSSEDGYLLKVKNNGNSGELALEVPTNGKSYSSPIIDGNQNVYFAADSGMVYSFNVETGALNWKSETYYTKSAPAPIYSTGALSEDGYLYIGDSKGVMYCFNTADGELAWSYRGEETSILGAIAYFQNWLFYTNADMFICLNLPNLKSIGLKSGSALAWGTFQGNNMRTGNLDNISDAPVSVKEVETSNIEIYPNPVQDDHIFIKLNNFQPSEINLQILNITGNTLSEMNVDNTGLLNVEFNYPLGIYFIKVTNQGQVYSYPIIKSGKE